MNWKNMMNKNAGFFGRGNWQRADPVWKSGQRMVWNLYISCSGNYKSGRTEMESERR